MLAQRHAHGEPPGLDVDAPSCFFEHQPEDGSVRDVDGEPDPPPARAAREELADERDIGVVMPDDSRVDRLLQRPDGGCDGTCGGRSGPTH